MATFYSAIHQCHQCHSRIRKVHILWSQCNDRPMPKNTETCVFETSEYVQWIWQTEVSDQKLLHIIKQQLLPHKFHIPKCPPGLLGYFKIRQSKSYKTKRNIISETNQFKIKFLYTYCFCTKYIFSVFLKLKYWKKWFILWICFFRKSATFPVNDLFIFKVNIRAFSRLHSAVAIFER